LNILIIGDIVGSVGLKALIDILPDIVSKFKIDFVIANAENVAGGLGLTPKHAKQLFSAGVHVLTSGNHIWRKKEIIDFIPTESRLIRPANYPEDAPGRGNVIVSSPNGNVRIGVINVLGQVFMEALSCPFRTVDREIVKIAPHTDVIIVDIHAEATSEKVAMGAYLNGRVTAVVGTHTHIQTADEKILSGGTAYITDLGMTGPHDSVIGVKKDIILNKFLTHMPRKFEVATEGTRINGVIVKVDERTGQAKGIHRLDIPHKVL